MAGRVCVFVGTSLDGFLAGPDDDLSWLPSPATLSPEALGFPEFLAQIGALLIGRNTWEIARRHRSRWPYGERPILVATHRELDSARAEVRAAAGSITELVEQARALAGDRDVYLDGGALIRQAIDAGLVDSLTTTIVPVALGAGTPLFTGLERPVSFELTSQRVLNGGVVQLGYRVRPRARSIPQPPATTERRRRARRKR